MTPEMAERVLALFALGLGAGDIAYATGLAKGTVVLFLIRRG